MLRKIIFLVLFSYGLFLTACNQDTIAQQDKESTQATGSQKTEAEQKYYNKYVGDDDIGSDLKLMDHNGADFALSQSKGNVTLVTFGYTHCPDVCPTTLLAFTEVFKKLGDEAKDIRFYFVTVDPERDTPDVMKQYMHMFRPDFMGLIPYKEQDMESDLRLWKIIAAKNDSEDSENYTVDHSVGTYALNKEGKVVLYIPLNASTDEVVSDLKVLLETVNDSV